MTTTIVTGRTVWGPFIIYPAGTRIEDVPDERGTPAYPDLAGRDLGEDPDVIRTQAFDGVPASARPALLTPDLPPGVELSGIWVLLAPDGSMYRSVMFWHRTDAPTRTLETADVVVGRSLAAPPPSIVVAPGTLPPDASVSGWSIEPVVVDGHEGIFHRFTNTAGGDREAQQANSLQWFDDDGYKMLLSGWNSSLDELLTMAATLKPPAE